MTTTADYTATLAEWGAQVLEDELGVIGIDRATVTCDTGQYRYQPYSTWTGDFTGECVVITGTDSTGAQRRWEYRDHTMLDMLRELEAVADGGRWDDPFKEWLETRTRGAR